MRRLAIMTSIIGAAAFAALLAWGLTFGGGAVQAQDASPTPTEAPIPCTPPFPGTFTGTVTIDGTAAPDGTPITALIEGVVYGSTTTLEGRYTLSFPDVQYWPDYPPCFPGIGGTTVVSFRCDSVDSPDTGIYTPGPPVEVNLTCAPVAPAPSPTPSPAPSPSPAASPTPSPSPTPTPTAAPPTGMGGMGGDGGFMWWPLALAAAALTSVAGLFTARWARR